MGFKPPKSQKNAFAFSLLFWALLFLVYIAVAIVFRELAERGLSSEPESVPTPQISRFLRGNIGDSRFLDIAIIPKCVLGCIYDRVLDPGFHCAHSDHHCICSQITRIASEKPFDTCFTGCNFLEDQSHSPDAIDAFCRKLGIFVEFPPFMVQHLHRRQSGSLSGAFPPASNSFQVAPTTEYTTTYTTLPYGLNGGTITGGVGQNSVATVVVGIAATISSTVLITTTILSNEVAYTSSFTNSASAILTEIIAIPAEQTSAPTTSGNILATTSSTGAKPTNTSATPSPSGLSTGAKIGIGVAVPLIVIALLAGFLLWWFKYRNSQAPVLRETDDGGLPEPTGPGWVSGTKPVSQPPPAYRGPDAQRRVESGGVPIHELSSTLEAGAGAQTQYATRGGRQEMRHEMGVKSPVLASTAVAEKPLSSVALPVAQSSVAPPWERIEGEEFAYGGPVSVSSPKTPEELEVERMEQEMAQVKLRKQRLLDVQALEQREEELKRAIESKRNTGGGAGGGGSSG